MGSFGSFTTVRLGIYAAQTGLDVTGNNISNINTVGYSRQRVEQYSLSSSVSDKYYSVFTANVGQGAVVTDIEQIRDPGLDITYRNSLSDVGSADAKLAGFEDLAAILDEVGKGGGDSDGQDDGVILKQMNDLRDIINTANTNGMQDFEALIRSSASSLTALFNSYSDKLTELERTYTEALEQDVETINGIIKGIQDLNISIRDAEIRGDSALELRDERNVMIDALSQYVKVDVNYSMEEIYPGIEIEKLTLTLTDEDKNMLNNGIVVDGVYASELSLGDEASGYAISVEPLKDVDGDQLYFTATANVLGDTELYGSLQSLREMLTEKGEYATAADEALDSNATNKRGIPYYQHALDSLAFTFAEMMNEINTTNAAGDDITGGGAYTVAGAGNLFSSNMVDPITGNPIPITAGNIAVSQEWADGTVSMLSSAEQYAPSGDRTNLARLLEAFSEEHTFDPEDVSTGAVGVDKTSSFEEMLFSIQSTLAEDQMVSTNALMNNMTVADNAFVARESVMGVNLNDEATSLITYQTAYTAAAKLMTTLDECLQSLLNMK